MSDILLVNANALSIPLADESVHAVITSPPYFNAREEYASWGSYKEYLADMASVWAECYRVLCDGGRIAINVPQGYGRAAEPYFSIGDDMTRTITGAGFTLRGHIVWNKSGEDGLTCINSTAWGSWQSASNPSLRDVHELIIVAHKRWPARKPSGISTISGHDFMEATKSVWNILPVRSSWHPAPFPPEIPRRLIELYTYLGDVVLDPFAGSGTTVKIARQLGRAGIGLDLSFDYLDRARRDTVEYRLDAWQHGRNGKTKTADLPLFARPEEAP